MSKSTPGARRTRRSSRLVAALVLAGGVVSGTARVATAHPRGLARPRPESHPTLRASLPEPGASCRPRRHLLRYHGGDLVRHAAIFVLFWGPDWSTDPEHQATAAALRTFFQGVGSSTYACAWREYAVPGQDIGPATYAGDEIVPTPPPTSGGEVSDDDIQAMIASEVAAGHAPPVSDDAFYVVVPPKGVPVTVSGESGCGGSNFTFCGYHDAFARLGHRYRYTALPYPCAGCFVDAGHDPGLALEEIASHELSETVTDPDAPPVGDGGWYDDATQDENADVCRLDGCDTLFPIGADTFVVNSLWSNLARACVAAANCSTPPPACTDDAPGGCVPNARDPDACAFEWHVEPNLTRARSGIVGSTVTCADGQSFCDADGVPDGQCTFRVAACLGSTDPRLSCVASPVTAVTLQSPSIRSRDPVDQANATTLLAALGDVDPGSTGTLSGREIAYAPPAGGANSCTAYQDVVVPTARGRRTLRLTAVTTAGRVTTSVKLVCNPTWP